MTRFILQLIFLVPPVLLPLALYRSRRPFMSAFYCAMAQSHKARKLYTQVLVVLLLLFHYVYTNGQPGQFGAVLSTIVCAVLFSCRRADRWLRKLHDQIICHLWLHSSGCMCRTAFVHDVCHHILYPFGRIILPVRANVD